MKRVILLSVCLFVLSANLLAQEKGQDEKELIKKVIQSAYVDGLCNNADVEAIKKGFHPGFDLLIVGNGNRLWKQSIANWIEDAQFGKKNGKKYSFQDELTTIKFVFVDVEGKAAVAKIEFYEGNEKKYIDYISLLKFEDGWKIVTKIYHPVPQPKK